MTRPLGSVSLPTIEIKFNYKKFSNTIYNNNVYF